MNKPRFTKVSRHGATWLMWLPVSEEFKNAYQNSQAVRDEFDCLMFKMVEKHNHEQSTKQSPK